MDINTIGAQTDFSGLIRLLVVSLVTGAAGGFFVWWKWPERAFGRGAITHPLGKRLLVACSLFGGGVAGQALRKVMPVGAAAALTPAETSITAAVGFAGGALMLLAVGAVATLFRREKTAPQTGSPRASPHWQRRRPADRRDLRRPTGPRR